MSIEIKFPAIPEHLFPAKVSKINYGVGEQFYKDDVLFQVDTALFVFDVPAPSNGKMDSCLVKLGDEIKSDQLLATYIEGGLSEADKEWLRTRKPIWVVCADAKILSNACSIAIDDSVFVQGELYVPADTIEDAISQAKQNLIKNHMEVLEVVKCIKYDVEEWKITNQEDYKDVLRLVELADIKQMIHSEFFGNSVDVEYSVQRQTRWVE